MTCDLEFMSVVVPWLEKCRAAGAELGWSGTTPGGSPPTRSSPGSDDGTRAVVLSSVQWTNGYRLDIQRIGQECRRREIPFIVDAIQHLGVVPFDVADARGRLPRLRRTQVARLADGPRLRLRERRLREALPSDLHLRGDGRAAARGLARELDRSGLRPDPDLCAAADGAPGSRSGSTTAPSAPAGLAARPRRSSTRSGRPASPRTRMALGDRVAAGVRALGLEVVTPLERDHRSGLTVFRGGPSPKDDLALRDYLIAREHRWCPCATRPASAGCGCPPHVYNDESDVDRLQEAVHAWLKTR